MFATRTRVCTLYIQHVDIGTPIWAHCVRRYVSVCIEIVSLCVHNAIRVIESYGERRTRFTSADCVAKRMAFGLVFVRISTQPVVLRRVQFYLSHKNKKQNSSRSRCHSILRFVFGSSCIRNFSQLVACECKICSTKRKAIKKNKKKV